MMAISKVYRFEAAHTLSRVPYTHQCSRLHGHSFQLEVQIQVHPEGAQEPGVRFDRIDRAVKPLLDNELDHMYLNEITGLKNPTSETLLVWIWNRLKPVLPDLLEITLKETASSKAIYRG